MEPKAHNQEQPVSKQEAAPSLVSELIHLRREFSEKDIFTHHLYHLMVEYQNKFIARDQTSLTKFLKPHFREFSKAAKEIGWDRDELEKIEEEFIKTAKLNDTYFYRSQLTSVPEEGGFGTIFNHISSILETYRNQYSKEHPVAANDNKKHPVAANDNHPIAANDNKEEDGEHKLAA